jgi:plastocyanin
MLAVFVPQQIQVSTGQSITWDNPSAVAEPHTVTFVLDNKTATELVSPFAVPSSTQFAAIITPQTPNSNNEPPKVPGQQKQQEQKIVGTKQFESMCELKRMYVSSSFRRLGLGQKFLDIAIGFAKSVGYSLHRSINLLFIMVITA